MRALVLGCGSIGSRHARNLVALDVEVITQDLDPDRARELAADVGGDFVVDRNDASVDVAVVATPTAVHASDAEWCLERGLHAFIEKPVASTREQLQHLASAARGSDRVAMVACNLRFSDGYRALREHLDGVGRIVSIIADFGWYLPAWKPGNDYAAGYSASREQGGGVILDAAIHEIDYVLDLAGPAIHVDGLWTASRSLGIGVEDAAEITMRHESGCISHVHVDYLRRRYTRTCAIVGAEGTLFWDFAAGSVSLVRETDHVTFAAEGLDGDRNRMYVEEMRHFLAQVTTGIGAVNDLSRAAATTEVALQALDQGGPLP
jgi:predicted dehydrogenase